MGGEFEFSNRVQQTEIKGQKTTKPQTFRFDVKRGGVVDSSLPPLPLPRLSFMRRGGGAADNETVEISYLDRGFAPEIDQLDQQSIISVGPKV